MPKLPIVKPREVTRALERPGVVEVSSRAHTSSIGILMVELRPCLFIPAEIFRPALLRQIIKDVQVSSEEFLVEL